MSKTIRVLLVEDSEFDAELVLLELRQHGYFPVFLRVETPASMGTALDQEQWDVVIADYVLPQFSGPEALQVMQQRKLDLPFIIVSGHIDEETAVASMKAGAHDYVMKDRLARLVPAIEREIEEAAIRSASRRSEELFAREQSFRRAIEDSIPSGIFSLGSDGRHTYVNSAFCAMVGWSEDELLERRSPFPYWPASDTEFLTLVYDGLARGVKPGRGVELRFQHRSGKCLDVLLLANLIHDRSGVATGWLASVTDISEAKEIERDLQVEILERRLAQEALRWMQDQLEQRVKERTSDLQSANSRLEEEFRERRRLEQELLDITEAERRRIGLDLHDDLGQKLAGLSLLAKGLELSLERKQLPELQQAREVAALVRAAMEHASGLARDLALVEMDQDNLPLALATLAEHVSQLFRVACTFEFEGKVPNLEKNAVLQLYKIAQEAVTNAVKHGPATQVSIRLAGKLRELELTVRNPGKAFPELLDKNKGMGLRIMNYRANVIGAALTIKAARPNGTLVTCRFPASAKLG